MSTSPRVRDILERAARLPRADLIRLRLAMACAPCFALTVMGGCANRTESPDGLFLALVPPRSVLIIGDSLTERSDGFGLSGSAGPALNVRALGIAGTDYRDWLVRLDDAFAEGGPPADIVLVPLGTNDGYRFTPAEHVGNVQRLHESIRTRSSATTYYFQMPRSNDGVLAANIRANNLALAANLPDSTVPLIDLDTPFETARSGPPLYPANDPIHPTDVGYRIIADEIRLRLLAP